MPVTNWDDIIADPPTPDLSSMSPEELAARVAGGLTDEQIDQVMGKLASFTQEQNNRAAAVNFLTFAARIIRMVTMP